jgi:hypothetical protein
MLHVFWLHVKYTLNVVQNTWVYIKCIGTPQKVTKLQPNLWYMNTKGLFMDEISKKLFNMEGCTI